jgi:hypothetical protein
MWRTKMKETLWRLVFSTSAPFWCNVARDGGDVSRLFVVGGGGRAGATGIVNHTVVPPGTGPTRAGGKTCPSGVAVRDRRKYKLKLEAGVCVGLFTETGLPAASRRCSYLVLKMVSVCYSQVFASLHTLRFKLCIHLSHSCNIPHPWFDHPNTLFCEE